MASTIVLTVISTAPVAGLNKISCLYNAPAAYGSGTILYPIVQIKFLINLQ
jgi:hypothetical protein